MTYKELAKSINAMTDLQKQCDVTVFVPGVGEFYPIDCVSYSTMENDVLDVDTPILNISDNSLDFR